MMKTYTVTATHNTPEIYLSSDEHRFEISGKSAPEDVRGLYYPLIEWMNSFVEEVKKANNYTEENPITFKLKLDYFNSSSAKFLFDIFTLLKDVNERGTPVVIEWYHDAEDIDLKEAGEDMAQLSGLNFRFCPSEKSNR